MNSKRPAHLSPSALEKQQLQNQVRILKAEVDKHEAILLLMANQDFEILVVVAGLEISVSDCDAMQKIVREQKDALYKALVQYGGRLDGKESTENETIPMPKADGMLMADGKDPIGKYPINQ